MATPEYVAAAAGIAVALAVTVAVWMTWRTVEARQRLDSMRAAAHHPSRRLVEVLQQLRGTRTGQLLLVVDVRTGQVGTVWLPIHSLDPGELALLVWMDGEWVLMDRCSARSLSRPVTTR